MTSSERKFIKFVNESEQPFRVKRVSLDPLTKILDVTVDYRGDHHGKLRPFQFQQIRFYGKQAQPFVDFCSKHVRSFIKKAKRIRVRFDG